jgi:RimJ/RimL family protein N-acetyltransferase
VPELILLRPVTEPELPLLERLYTDPVEASEYGFFGWRSPGGIRRDWAENGCVTQDAGRLSVLRGEEFVGMVSWHKMTSGPTSYCWNIGIGLLVKARGRGYGTRAQRLVVEYLFSHTQVNRIEAGTEVSNLAEQRALEKAGFTREGVRRGSCFRHGVWRDMVSYSILRAEVGLGG